MQKASPHRPSLNRVLDHENLRKDPRSKVVLNTDSKALKDYSDKKAIAEMSREKIKEQETRIEAIEEKMDRVLSILEHLVKEK